MERYIPAPDSEDEFVEVLLSGKTVYLETETSIRPVKLIERLNDVIARMEGVFESDTRLITQAVMAEDVATKWSEKWSEPNENTGLLFWLEGPRYSSNGVNKEENSAKVTWSTAPAPPGYTWYFMETDGEYSGSIFQANMALVRKIEGTIYKGEERFFEQTFFSINAAKKRMAKFIDDLS